MYLSRRIMENLGHQIRIDSTLGEGTTVYLDLRSAKLEVE
jgi:signal transduction histidine kinase